MSRVQLPGGLSRAAEAPRRFLRSQLRLGRDSIECFVGMDGFDRSMALAAQGFTALIPLVIVVAATAEAGDGRTTGEQIVERFHLSGTTATSVRRALPPSGTVKDSLSALSVVILVFTATSFTRALRARVGDQGQQPARRAMWPRVAGRVLGLRGAAPGPARPRLGRARPGRVTGVGNLFWLLTPYDRELALRRGAGADRVGRDRCHAVADEALAADAVADQLRPDHQAEHGRDRRVVGGHPRLALSEHALGARAPRTK
jgi:hypothetical protein